MVAVFLFSGLVLFVLLLVPALILQARASRENRAKRSWARVFGTVVRVENAQYYVPDSDGSGGHYQNQLIGTYQYSDPHGGVHHGRAPVAGVNLVGEPEPIPILVNPLNWDESMAYPRRSLGCTLAVLWTLPVLCGLGLLLALVMVRAALR